MRVKRQSCVCSAPLSRAWTSLRPRLPASRQGRLFPVSETAPGFAAALTGADSKGSRSWGGCRVWGGLWSGGVGKGHRCCCNKRPPNLWPVTTHKVGCGCGRTPAFHTQTQRPISPLRHPSTRYTRPSGREHAEGLMLTGQPLVWSRPLSLLSSPTAELVGGPPSHRGWRTGRSSWTSAVLLPSPSPAFPEARAGVRLGRKLLPSCLIPQKPP